MLQFFRGLFKGYVKQNKKNENVGWEHLVDLTWNDQNTFVCFKYTVSKLIQPIVNFAEMCCFLAVMRKGIIMFVAETFT